MNNNNNNTNNLLIHNHPDLLNSEWDYELNNANNINANTVTCGSHVKAHWKCNAYGHSYEMMIKERVKGSKCPYCMNRKVLPGFNDLQSNYPDLVNSEWDWELNDAINVKPDMLTYGSSMKVYWKCVNNHHWKASVNRRTSMNTRCPYCTGLNAITGVNDLLTLYANIIKTEWEWVENSKKNLEPSELKAGSNRKASWHCNTCHGRYEMSIYAKIICKQSCPYCIGKKTLPGYNDLETLYPDLAKEWYQPMNGNITARMVTPGSETIRIKDKNNPKKTIRVKPAWKCRECSHIWHATVYSRTGLESGCPACWQHTHKSKQEDEVACYISNYLCEHHTNIKYTMKRSISFKEIYEHDHVNMNADIISAHDNYSKHMRMELDVYIPELNFAIEYDGDYWHDDKIMMRAKGITNADSHRIKQELCKQAGIELIFITEHDWLHDNNMVKQDINHIIDNMLIKMRTHSRNDNET